MLKNIFFVFLLIAIASPVQSTLGFYYVSTANLPVYQEPKVNNLSIIRRLQKYDKVKVFEIKNEWARISKHYDGGMHIKDRLVADWVKMDHLTRESGSLELQSFTKAGWYFVNTKRLNVRLAPNGNRGQTRMALV